MDLYNTRDRTQDIEDVKIKSKILPRYQRSKILPRFPRSCQDIQDEIQDLTKKLKMSRQDLRSIQDIQEFKTFLRSWQDIQDVKRWERSTQNGRKRMNKNSISAALSTWSQ